MFSNALQEYNNKEERREDKGQGYTSKLLGFGLSQDELFCSVYMTLNSRASSKYAKALTADLISRLSTGTRTLVSKSQQALDGVLADLMKAAQTPGRYAYRKTSAGSFSGELIGYQPFKRVIDALSSASFVDVVRGYGGGTARGWATRFRATDKLLNVAAGHGVEPREWSKHYSALPRPTVIRRPIALRRSSKLVKGHKQPGSEIGVDLSRSPASELAEQVNRLNTFFAKVSIEPADAHFAFQRLFNQGELSEFNWNKGGRLYSLGVSYQQMKSDDRKLMRLNGEPVIEIDLRASHLTILHALLRLPFDPADDPYDIPTIPRDIAKRWVTMTLGYDRFQTRWSKANKDQYRDEVGGDLQKDYPIRSVRECIIRALPVLKDWPTCKVRWGDLQYVESCIIIEAMEQLAEENVPALPVHDSIIVPASQQVRASAVLKECFRKRVGLLPGLKTKYAPVKWPSWSPK